MEKNRSHPVRAPSHSEGAPSEPSLRAQGASSHRAEALAERHVFTLLSKVERQMGMDIEMLRCRVRDTRESAAVRERYRRLLAKREEMRESVRRVLRQL